MPRFCSLLIVQPFPFFSSLNGTMASADFWLFSYPSLGRLPRVLGVSTRPPRVRTQSFPPPICFIYCMRPSAERALFCLENSSNDTQQPYMKFVFLRPEVCRPLPSDSTSPWTPLRLANCYFCLHSSGLAPYRLRPCWAHQKNRHRIPEPVSI